MDYLKCKPYYCIHIYYYSDSDGTRLLTGTPATMSGGQVNTYPRHVFTKLSEKLMFDGLFNMQTIYIILLRL